MEEQPNSDPNSPNQQQGNPPAEDASTPYFNNPSTVQQFAPGSHPAAALDANHVRANTALMKLSRSVDEAESKFGETGEDGNTPLPMGDDLENTEAASARIAQEY